jgi:hypothetical protein
MGFTGKRSGSETRKREPIIGFRATADERSRIEAAASRAGLTVGSYVRSRALKKPTTRAVRRPAVETAQLAQVLGLIGTVGGDLHHIAKNFNAGGGMEDAGLKDALTRLREAASAIMRALGKRAS